MKKSPIKTKIQNTLKKISKELTRVTQTTAMVDISNERWVRSWVESVDGSTYRVILVRDCVTQYSRAGVPVITCSECNYRGRLWCYACACDNYSHVYSRLTWKTWSIRYSSFSEAKLINSIFCQLFSLAIRIQNRPCMFMLLWDIWMYTGSVFIRVHRFLKKDIKESRVKRGIA